MKIIELLQSKRKQEVTYSLEFFPPKTAKGIETLNERIQKIASLEESLRPLFIDITWGAGGSTKDLTLQLATQWTKITDVNKNNIIVNMHLTCKNMSTKEVNQTLHIALQNNITNIIALRGDLPKDAILVEDHFKSALDLLTYMKQKFVNEFCVSVSGYPEGHPDAIEDISIDALNKLSDSEKLRLSIQTTTSEDCSENHTYAVCMDSRYDAELTYLKQKVDAGADFIITQLFYDPYLFLAFLDKCRKIGITCPILPGIMVIYTYSGFQNMVKLCKTKVPRHVYDNVEKFKNDNEQVAKYGISLAKEIILILYQSGINHFHLYTMNRDTSEIIDYIQTLK